MASSRPPFSQQKISSVSLTLFLFFFLSVRSQIPANRTFRIVNEGDFSDYIVEYDANYRPISSQTQVYDLFAYPFYLSFYNTTPNAYILAIRAGLPRDEDLMRWVWDANRNNPVGENATLTFGRDGNLVLAEADGRVKWQTNTANKGVDGIRMLPNGNLVLYDKKGRFVWQSFDYPSDTLLVGMSLRFNGRNKLVSRTSDSNPSDGPYSMVLESDGNLNMYLNHSGQSLLYNGWTRYNFGERVTFDITKLESSRYNVSEAYELGWRSTPYPSPPSSRRLLQSRPSTTGDLLNLVKLNYNATLSFIRLGSDGNLKAYTYYLPSDYLKWAETYSFFGDDVRECGLPSKCGKFGYCSNRMCVGCPSPKGMLGWSESCSPPKLPPCSSKGTAAARYYKIVGVEHFLNPIMDDGEGPIKVEECRSKCDRDCKCAGFIYKEDTSKCLLAPLLATLIKVENASVGYIKY